MPQPYILSLRCYVTVVKLVRFVMSPRRLAGLRLRLCYAFIILASISLTKRQDIFKSQVASDDKIHTERRAGLFDKKSRIDKLLI